MCFTLTAGCERNSLACHKSPTIPLGFTQQSDAIMWKFIPPRTFQLHATAYQKIPTISGTRLTQFSLSYICLESDQYTLNERKIDIYISKGERLPEKPFLSLSVSTQIIRRKKYKRMSLRPVFVIVECQSINKPLMLGNNDFTLWNRHRCSFLLSFWAMCFFAFSFLLWHFCCLPPHTRFWAVFQAWCPLLVFSGFCPKNDVALLKYYFLWGRVESAFI